MHRRSSQSDDESRFSYICTVDLGRRDSSLASLTRNDMVMFHSLRMTAVELLPDSLVALLRKSPFRSAVRSEGRSPFFAQQYQ
jgi:hypothetical protein